MRIIGGKFGGRRINPPHLSPTRPTTDYAREGLFNILENNFDLSTVSFLDLFGGTGCISYEMASRGCTYITTVDKHYECIAFMKKTIAELDIPFMKPIKTDVFKFIDNCDRQFDLIFAGPPYPLKTLDTIPDRILKKDLLKPNGWLILEHNPAHNFTQHPNFLQQRNYGTTIFVFFTAVKK
jgi:16S rRNA (guanine966-N2)-methyltransferase